MFVVSGQVEVICWSFINHTFSRITLPRRAQPEPTTHLPTGTCRVFACCCARLSLIRRLDLTTSDSSLAVLPAFMRVRVPVCDVNALTACPTEMTRNWRRSDLTWTKYLVVTLDGIHCNYGHIAIVMQWLVYVRNESRSNPFRQGFHIHQPLGGLDRCSQLGPVLRII